MKLIFQRVRKCCTLVKVDAEMTNEHIKMCSIIVITNKMKNKSRVRYQFINLRMVKIIIKKNLTLSDIGKDLKPLEYLHADGNIK